MEKGYIPTNYAMLFYIIGMTGGLSFWAKPIWICPAAILASALLAATVEWIVAVRIDSQGCGCSDK
jgi:hypothetical protein